MEVRREMEIIALTLFCLGCFCFSLGVLKLLLMVPIVTLFEVGLILFILFLLCIGVAHIFDERVNDYGSKEDDDF